MPRGMITVVAFQTIAVMVLRRLVAVAGLGPVLVEYWAAGLTWGYGTDMIGTHVSRAGVPAAGAGAVLARVAGPVVVGQGRGDTRAAARGGRAEPGEPSCHRCSM